MTHTPIQHRTRPPAPMAASAPTRSPSPDFDGSDTLLTASLASAVSLAGAASAAWAAVRALTRHRAAGKSRASHGA